MVVRDILEKFAGEIRVHNIYDETDVGIINTAYKGWVKLSYTNCDVVRIELEMLNTAVLSARLVVIIDDADAGQDSGDVEEATKQDIADLIDSIYEDVDGNNMTEDEETIRVITEDYYHLDPVLPGDENQCEDATDEEVEEIIDDVYPNNEPAEDPSNQEPEPTNSESEDDTEEATEDDINNLMGSLYND